MAGNTQARSHLQCQVMAIVASLRYLPSPHLPMYITSIRAPRNPHLLQRIRAPIAPSVACGPNAFSSSAKCSGRR
jgi:hypothetical protein